MEIYLHIQYVWYKIEPRTHSKTRTHEIVELFSAARLQSTEKLSTFDSNTDFLSCTVQHCESQVSQWWLGRLIEPKDVFLGTCTTTPQPMQITTHGPYTRALVFCIDRCSVCGTTSEGRLNLIQYLWIEVGSFVPSTKPIPLNSHPSTTIHHRHSSSVLVLALGLQDTGHQTGVYTRRVALLVNPSPVVVGWKCLVAGAISCCCCYWPYWCCWHQTMKAPEFCRA